MADFDRVAKVYRWMEYLSFGGLLERTRECRLDAVGGCRRALVLGDGDGRFTAALLAANPLMQVHAVDGSAAMLGLLVERCSQYKGRLTTERADLRGWAPARDAVYDLVTTHFFLDCLTSAEAAALALRIAPAAAPGALWLVSEFAVPQTRYGRWIAAPVVAALYWAFGWMTGLRVRRLPDHAAALCRGGWQRQAARQMAGGLLVSEMWRRSAAVHCLGS
jgi:SAM-dependent methyltransferase